MKTGQKSATNEELNPKVSGKVSDKHPNESNPNAYINARVCVLNYNSSDCVPSRKKGNEDRKLGFFTPDDYFY